ncbi:MAG: hypothetical protein K2L78_05460 [Muribaculaceae bacterium]|nr:hypothetical protein [Muribaculaceae bacterium]
MTVDECLDTASEAIADGDYGHAQQLCNGVIAMLDCADSTQVDETRAVALGILYMRLSEHCNEDENIADATQCIRYALRRSGDSLRIVSAELPLDDVRHFELLRRIGLSIDNPVDLSDRDMTHAE